MNVTDALKLAGDYADSRLSAAGWTEDGPLLRSPVKAKAAS